MCNVFKLIIDFEDFAWHNLNFGYSSNYMILHVSNEFIFFISNFINVHSKNYTYKILQCSSLFFIYIFFINIWSVIRNVKKMYYTSLKLIKPNEFKYPKLDKQVLSISRCPRLCMSTVRNHAFYSITVSLIVDSDCLWMS